MGSKTFKIEDLCEDQKIEDLQKEYYFICDIKDLVIKEKEAPYFSNQQKIQK